MNEARSFDRALIIATPTQDPIGLAGGVNLYAYAGNNPVAFSDPYGLCPYKGKGRDENVDDCPKDRLGSAFRLLKRDGGVQGARTIRSVAKNKVNITVTDAQGVNQACQGQSSTACTAGNKITIVQASAGETAARLSHETTHIDVNASAGAEEMQARNNALDVYDGLRGSEAGQSSYYDPESQWRKRDPTGYNQAACLAGGGPPC